ncbi:MAG: ATP-binding protein [Gammaproteobacteria bacterium]|nr:ATP-binding protein [Gammaproteobacteria bacterium]
MAELLVKSDLQDFAGRLIRHEILLGTREDGEEVRLQPYGVNVMIAGGGKSTLATGLLERLAEKKYQYCIIDPEGDYSSLDDVVVLGDNRRPPSPDEVLDLLSEPEQNAVISNHTHEPFCINRRSVYTDCILKGRGDSWVTIVFTRG